MIKPFSTSKKLFYIVERNNPQFKNVYYIGRGQLSKKDAKICENPSYGSSTLLSYKTEAEYNEALRVKQALAAFNIKNK